MRKYLTPFRYIVEFGAVHHLGTCFASQTYIFLISAAPTRTVRAACIVHFLFATPLGLAASLRPDGFVSGAVCFVRRTLARSAFLGFQIGAPRWKSVLFYWIPKVQKCVHFRFRFFSPKRRISVNLGSFLQKKHKCKSWRSRQELSFFIFRFYLQTMASMYSRERASQSMPKISQKLETN